MLLILGDERLDFRKFPDLMTQRFGIGPAEFFAATAALLRQARHHALTLLDGNQIAFVLLVSGLSAALAGRLGFVADRLGMRMRGRRGQRGIRGRFAAGQLCFEMRDARGKIFQQCHDGRRQRCEDFR